MNKKVLIVAGATVAAIVLVVAAVFASLNVARAATQVGRAIAQSPALQALSIKDQVTPTEKGLVVVVVQANSAADKAGLKRGDILLKIDNQEINTLADYRNALSSHKVGDQVKLTVTHGDDQRTLTATLDNRNGNPDLGILPFGGGFGRGGRGFGFFGHGEPFSGTQTLVISVTAGSPADKAGLKSGDVIVSVDGKALDGSNALATVISSHKPGDTVTLQVVSSGQSQRDVKVTLGNNPNKAGTAYLGVSYREGGARMFRGGNGQKPFPGMPFTQTVGSGALIRSVSAGSPADKAGLKQGDIITAIDGATVASPQALSKVISAHKPGDTVTLSVKHSDNTTADVKVTLGDNPNNAGTAYLGITSSPNFNMPFGNGQQGLGPRFRTPGGLGRNFGGSGSGQQNPGQSQPAPLGDGL